ncbi:MAG: hypothetical protein CSA66_05805 [Proteobacteria bacterium]|nr:MAG: hypothetical protein CSA66_05805 [Pseudomonadota bacterium]
MTRNQALIALPAVAVFTLAACGGDKMPPKEEFPALGQAAALKLLAPGADPKTPLRWKSKVGGAELVTMAVDITTEISVAGQTMPMNVKMTMDMKASVDEVLDDGSAHVTMEVLKAGLEMPGMQAGDTTDTMNEMLAGMKISSTIDPRGVTSETEVLGANPMLGQLVGSMGDSLDQISIPFPEEAVGIGAKWQALTTQESNGMKVRMVATYELTELEGDTGKVKLSLQQFGDPQTINMNGATGKLDKLESTGSGDMAFDLTKPGLAQAAIRMKLEAELELMGESADMKMDAKLSLEPKGAPSGGSALGGE